MKLVDYLSSRLIVKTKCPLCPPPTPNSNNDVLRLLSQIKVGEMKISDLSNYQIKKLTKEQEKIMKALRLKLKLKNSVKH